MENNIKHVLWCMSGEQSQENVEKRKDKNKNNRKIIELASECIPHEHIMQSGKAEKERRYEKDR